MKTSLTRVAVLSALLLASSAALPLFAAESYQTPSQALVDIVDAKSTPQVRVSPDRTLLAILESADLQSIGDLAKPELRIAGTRIDPASNGRSRSRPYAGLELMRIADGKTIAINGLPEDPKIAAISWSPDGEHLSLILSFDDRHELWVASTSSGEARRLLDSPLSAIVSRPQWLGDSSGLIAATVPSDRGVAPEAPATPPGPIIQESAGRKAPARTYQDLLQTPHDEDLFDHYFTAQLTVAKLDGTSSKLGKPVVLFSFEAAPSADLVLVEHVKRPYSYRVPMPRFPREIEIWDLSGKAVHTVASLPLQEEVPMAFGSVPTGPRSVTWRPDQDATLLWVEALDGGDARAEVDKRDRLFSFAAPFSGEPTTLTDLGLRYSGAQWTADGDALVSESWWQTRQTRTWRLTADGGLSQLIDRSYEDRYSDPGSPNMTRNDRGQPLLDVASAGGSQLAVMFGSGASPQGDRPFVDVLDLTNGQSDRLFRSEAPVYEQPIDVLARDEKGRPRELLTRRESPDDPPNYFVRNLENDELRQLTRFEHPTPSLAGISKEIIHYQRDDGVELTATLYLPAGYEPTDGPLPMLMWAYPREFKSAAAASQVRDSPYRFNRINYWSPLIWLARGYAVLNSPAMPIIGEGDQEPNDTYVEQLVGSAKAAVDAVVDRGVTSRDQIAIGGHSYGAFMTANLLAHSDLFAAGIARSGAFNRTLTPFGFQAEQRSVWEAPEIYFAMSPFMHAHKVNEPILLIHGSVDNNSGTFPMQSERFYSALKGNGATARLVMLPHESHGYRARESLLHMLWEQEQWLDRYVRANTAAAPSSGGK